jgi:hypothetical protein
VSCDRVIGKGSICGANFLIWGHEYIEEIQRIKRRKTKRRKRRRKKRRGKGRRE